jgi:NADP-reducing hydrogenase subunit HndB
MKYCHAEPVVEVHKPGKKSIVFGYVTTQKAVEIVDKYIKNDELIDNVLSIDNTSITNTEL